MAQSNPFLLAAETPNPSPALLPLLRSNPSLASSQDEHGYSLLHAAASYNHLSLLRTLISEFHVPINLRDEDGETCLFVCETVDCAKLLVEELGVDLAIRNDEGKNARERIEEEGDFTDVAVYLRIKELESMGNGDTATAQVNSAGLTNGVSSTTEETNGLNGLNRPPPVPEGISVNIGTMSSDEVGEDVVDPEFRRRIEELAAREDFEGEDGQRALRDLITEAVRGQVGEEREVRQRTS